MSVLMIGTRRHEDGRYEGVLRDGKTIVFACGHQHGNRDQSTFSNSAARPCVSWYILAGRVPELVAERRREILGGPAAYARSWGTSGGTVRRMQEAAEKSAQEMAEAVAKLKEIVGNRAVCSYKGVVQYPAIEECE